jgi:transcriptional regulator with XRE-family HTH domain
MKRSGTALGATIQRCLLDQGVSVDSLAREMSLNPDALSNLIHGKRRFHDETLQVLAQTTPIQEAELSLDKLKALRLLDEYAFEVVVLALVEAVRRGVLDRLPEDFFDLIRLELNRDGFPPSLGEAPRTLLELMQAGQLKSRPIACANSLPKPSSDGSTP